MLKTLQAWVRNTPPGVLSLVKKNQRLYLEAQWSSNRVSTQKTCWYKCKNFQKDLCNSNANAKFFKNVANVAIQSIFTKRCPPLVRMQFNMVRKGAVERGCLNRRLSCESHSHHIWGCHSRPDWRTHCSLHCTTYIGWIACNNFCYQGFRRQLFARSKQMLSEKQKLHR